MSKFDIEDRHERFMRLFIGSEPKIRAYGLACGLRHPEVDDLAQELALVLWRRFEDYDPARPFIGWAIGVTKHLIQELRKKGSRREALLGEEAAARLADTSLAQEAILASRRAALDGCIKKLPRHAHEVIRLRYGEGLSLAELGSRLGKELSAINMMLHRVRRLLLECVAREAAG